MSHIGMYCYNNIFFTNISGANWKSTSIHVDPALLEGSCAKAVLFATIWPHSTPVSIWLLTLGSISTSLSLLLSLDLILLSGLPGFDSWLPLKDFGQEVLQITLNVMISLESVSLAWICWPSNRLPWLARGFSRFSSRLY